MPAGSLEQLADYQKLDQTFWRTAYSGYMQIHGQHTLVESLSMYTLNRVKWLDDWVNSFPISGSTNVGIISFSKNY
jgi:hypothetical protein